jgi:LysR family transcriptional regulator, low CO2-responsive transcriptional regulator
MQIRHLTFRLLQVFVAVVEQGSVSEAARRLHLTQPTVSQQLKRLREISGEPLLSLQQGRLQPTDAGLELYRTSRDVLARFAEFDTYLDALRGGARGHFSVALVNTAQYVLPRLLGPYSRHYPEVDVTVQIGNREQVLARFDRQDDDVYVFSHPPASPQALSGRFLRNPLVVVAPANHPLAHQEHCPLNMAQLLDERFLLREPGSATRMLFEQWLQHQGLHLRHRLQMASNEAIRVGVAAGMGLAVLSEHVLPSAHPELTVLAVDGFPISSHWQFIVHRDRRLPHAARRFLQFVAAHLDEIVEPRFSANAVPGLLSALRD